MLSTIPPHPVPPPFPVPPADPGPRAPLQPPLVYVTPTWEYKHLERALEAETPIPDGELNALGAEGWELVAALPAGSRVHFYFKRSRD